MSNQLSVQSKLVRTICLIMSVTIFVSSVWLLYHNTCILLTHLNNQTTIIPSFQMIIHFRRLVSHVVLFMLTQ